MRDNPLSQWPNSFKNVHELSANDLRLGDLGHQIEFCHPIRNLTTNSVQFKIQHQNLIPIKGQCQFLINFDQFLINFDQFSIKNIKIGFISIFLLQNFKNSSLYFH